MSQLAGMGRRPSRHRPAVPRRLRPVCEETQLPCALRDLDGAEDDFGGPVAPTRSLGDSGSEWRSGQIHTWQSPQGRSPLALKPKPNRSKTSPEGRDCIRDKDANRPKRYLTADRDGEVGAAYKASSPWHGASGDAPKAPVAAKPPTAVRQRSTQTSERACRPSFSAERRRRRQSGRASLETK